MEKLLLLFACILVLSSCENEEVCCTCTDKTIDLSSGAVINQQTYDTCFLNYRYKDDYVDENNYTSHYKYETICRNH